MAAQRRPGWGTERGAVARGFLNADGSPRPQSFSNGWNPACHWVALLSMLDPVATAQDHAWTIKNISCDEVAAAMERLRAYDETRYRRAPMESDEIKALYDRQTGRGNSRILTPQTNKS